MLNLYNTKKYVQVVLLLVFSVMFYPIAVVMPSTTLKEPVFQLHILEKDWLWYKLHLQNTPEDVWSALKAIDISSESYFKMDESDIENYNWSDQSILLTVESSMRFLGISTKRIDKLNMEQLIKKAEASVNLGLGIDGSVFIILFEGEKLYGGAVDNVVSTKGYQVPTIFVQIATIHDTLPKKVQVRLVIRPLKTVRAILTGYQALDQQLKNRIEKREIHNFFEKKNKLTNDNTPERVEPWLPKIKPIVK